MNWLPRLSRTLSIPIYAQWYRRFAPIILVRYRRVADSTRAWAIRAVVGAGRHLGRACKLRQESVAQACLKPQSSAGTSA